VARLTHFVSREAFNIEGLSEKTIIQFYNDLNFRHYSDFYRLRKDELVALEKIQEKKAQNILDAVEKSKHIELFRFVFGLGISEVGIKTAKDLTKHFDSLEKLKNAIFEELLEVEDVGEIIANNIVEYFKDENNLREINLLLDAGVVPYCNNASKSDKLNGLTFVLTGTLEHYTRPEMTKIIEENGGKTASSVSAKTSYVLAGAEAGSKLAKAQSLGVKILTEEEFFSKFIDN
jgi:DNA ligase (NAD+)